MKTYNEIPKACVIYVRVSDDKQVDNTSLDFQLRTCREYAKRNQWEVLKEYVEEGESAKTSERSEFNKALAFTTTKRNRIGYFLVYKLDRFMRNQDEHGAVSALLRRNGSRLRSASEPIDDSPVGRLTEGMLASIAEFDNNVRSERSSNGMQNRLNQGMWVYPEPIGYYRPVPNQNIAPDLEKASHIRMTFEEYAKGTYTYKSLAEYVSNRGFRTENNKKPRPQLIYKIIRNPLYCGIMKVKGQTYDGRFEPIISKELFNKCQPNYTERSSHAAPRSANNAEFPLRRMFICSECGEPYTGSKSTSRNGTKHPYYHHQKQGCPKAKFIPKLTFEQNFVELLEEITPDSQYEKLFKAIVVEVWQQNYKQLDNENIRLRKEIEKLEQERQKVFDFHRAGKYTDEEMIEQKALINEHINQKRLLIQGKAVEELNMDEALDYCFRFIRQTAKVWQIFEEDYQLRLRFQKRVFPSGKSTYDGKEFGTSTLSPIYRINMLYKKQKSSLVALRGIEPRLPG